MDAITVSIESLQEFQVQEVSLDGQETYTKPLSMSESLAKLAHKIDFTKAEGEDVEDAPADDDKDGKKCESKEEAATVQAGQWPWESVHNKLRCALTEISVLSDILHICRWAREPRYMVLDPVSQEQTQSKQIIQLLDKKKSLSGAASILQKGATRMMRQPPSVTSSPQKSQHQNDFHSDLLRLRHHWRLKKVGSNILGDLSFRTAGSRFWHSGTFEVTKTMDTDCDASDKKISTPLKVTIPSDIEGTSYIQVLIQEGEAEIASAFLSQPSRSRVSADAHWQERLEAAQTVLFCKEVFAQIAREAVQLKSPVPHIVVGNQIFCTLFPGVQLCLALCHNTCMDSQSACSNDSLPGLRHRFYELHWIEPVKKPNHSHALEHSLHQLLRELHRSNMSGSTPHPITASLTVSKKRRLAGPQAASRKELADSQQGECLLEKVLKQAKHIVLRKRVTDVLDQLSCDLHDPVILVHWSAHTQPLISTAKVHISTSGCETQAMTVLQLTVEADRVRMVCKDGRVIHVNHEEQQLKDLLRCQISQHQIASVFSLSKSMSMQVLHYNNHVGVGPAPKLGNASSILVTTHHGKRMLGVRSDPLSGTKVLVKGCKNPRDAEQRSNVVTDPKWETIMADFREVDMDRIPGRNFVNKLELLMAVLAS